MGSPHIWGADASGARANNITGVQSDVDASSGTGYRTRVVMAVDPTSVATLGDPGCILINPSTGVIYEKEDSGSSTNWHPLNRHKVTSSRASPSSISAAGGIAFTGKAPKNIWFVKGDTADSDVDVSANPQVAAGDHVGQELVIIGRSDTDRIILEDGNGLALNGAYFVGADSVLSLIWDGTSWVEKDRR